MRIPKYQWLMSEPNNTCDFCDEIAIPSDYVPKFQLVANNDGDNLTPSLDLETNPFNPITSDDLSFELVLPMAVGKYFTLYLGTEIIIFQSGSSTSFVNVGNLWFAQLPNLIKPAKIVEFLNNNIDPLIGTISSQTTGVILIENVPTGSFLDDNLYNTLTNINTIGAQEIPAISVTNGYYDNVSKSICFYNFIDASFILRYELALTAGKRYKFTFSNITEFRDWIDGKFRIYDLSDIYEFDIVYGNVNTIYFTAVSSVSHIIDIVLDNATIPHTDGICFDDFSVYEVEQLVSIEMIDCFDQETDVDYGEFTVNANTLITILSTLPEVFQLRFTDSSDNVFYSRWYVIKDQDECIGDIKIRWTNECKLGELDYLNLPFVNQLYLTGVKIKLPLELHDSADSITPDGRKISIYKNTQAVYELRLHPYLEQTQDNLERIFEHSEVYINDEKYNAVDIYKTSEIDNGIYTGLVDILKEDTQLITSACCC
jgi:hypothetical protein